MKFSIKGKFVDIFRRDIYPAEISILDDKIESVKQIEESLLNGESNYIMPGFIDSHCHIESSMLNPIEFGRNAIKHGTIASVSDPHEIANVCGIDGLEYMNECAKLSPMKIFFSLPSCVPAVDFEVTGAKIDAEITKSLISDDRYIALSEMMNVPGVLFKDPGVIAKLEAAKGVGKPIDGHAPGTTGDALKQYISEGISTDHEVTTLEEAEEKIALGMKIQIREGSSAKSLATLMPLIDKYPRSVLLCTDDYKAFDLRSGYINKLVACAVKGGCNIYNVIRAASANVVEHYNIPVGLLREGDDADFIIVNNLDEFDIKAAYIKGKECSNINYLKYEKCINRFEAEAINANDIPNPDKEHIIGLIKDSLCTKHLTSYDESDNISTLVCYNRYQKGTIPASAVVKGFNLSKGAFGSTVGHDSHNITVVGKNNRAIAKVIETLVNMKGGMVVYDEENVLSLPLPIGGLMSNKSIDEVSAGYKILHDKIKELGCDLPSPLMTLAFMSLPVIPSLKITTKGLFDVDKFEFVKQ